MGVVALERRSYRHLGYLLPFLALAVCAAVIAQVGTAPFPDSLVADDRRYMAMAAHPFSADIFVRLAPYCWRLLVPLTVHLLPLPTLTGFWVATVVGLAVLVFAVMWLLDALDFSQTTVIAGGLATVLFGPMTFASLWDYRMVDAVSCALLTLSIAAAVRRHGLWLLAFLALGAAGKETIVFGVVFAVLWTLESRDRRMLGFACAGAVLVAAILLTIRFLVHPAMENSLPLLVGDVANMLWRQPAVAVTLLVGSVWGTWGLLSPFIAAQFIPLTDVRRSRAVTYTLMAGTGQLLLAADERAVAMVFPAAIVAAAYAIERFANHVQLPAIALWIPILAGNTWLAAPFARGADPPVPPGPTPQWTLTAAIAFASVAIATVLATRQFRRDWRTFLSGGLRLPRRQFLVRSARPQARFVESRPREVGGLAHDR